LRLPVTPLCVQMQELNLKALACSVNGTKFKEFAWVETGVMFFSVPYLRDSNFVERYNWQDGVSKAYPNTPEAVICKMLADDYALNLVADQDHA
jgi:hypothetical protein